MIITRGCGELSYKRDPQQRPNLVVLGGTFEPIPEDVLERGYTARVVNMRRNSNQTLSPNLKTGNLLNPRLAAMEAFESQVDEGIMLNVDGNLAEASTSNLFLVLPGGVLATPHRESGLLEGVTRKVMLELARQLGLPVREEALPGRLLEEAEEIFLSSTTRALAPIRQMGARKLATPGPVTRKLMDAFRAYAGSL